MAHYEDITIDQGADYLIELNVYNSNGSKRDLSGHTIKAWMKRSFDDDSDSAVKFTTNLVAPASDGIITLRLSNVQTDALEAKKKYFYDVELVRDSDGQTYIERILEGTAYITPSVTR